MSVLTVMIPVPAELPTANRRWHWARRAKVVAEMRAAAAWVGKSARIKAGEPPAVGRRYLAATLTRKKSRGRRQLDWDAAVQALKPSVDGLVTSGILAGDDPTRLVWVGVDQVWGESDFVTFRVADDVVEVAV